MQRTIRVFRIHFRYVTANVRVWRYNEGDKWTAQLHFPDAYMEPEKNGVTLEVVTAADISKAAEVYYLHYKELYSFLDLPIATVNKESFCVTRAEFKGLFIKFINKTQFSFVASSHRYCISKIIDGRPYHFTKFTPRHDLSVVEVTLIINSPTIFDKMHTTGFKFKFILRTIRKLTSIKVSSLPVWNSLEIQDKMPPQGLRPDNYIKFNQRAFYDAMANHLLKSGD